MAGNLTKEIIKFLKKQPDKKFIVKDIANAINTKNKNSIPKSLRERFDKVEGDTIPNDLLLDFRRIVSVILAYNAEKDKLPKERGKLQRVEGEGFLKYYYTEKHLDEAPYELSSEDKEEDKKLEKALYPILSAYLKTKAIGSIRINENKSSNNLGKGGNRWLHPDVIGVQYLSDNWNSNVGACAKGSFGSQIKLWSFEVKTVITRNNVRDYFFQAVANSSWANFGYLAIEKIDGADRELRMLCNRHGIGVIIINRNKSIEGGNYIHTPARENYDVDWEMVHRLFEENPDFEKGIKSIRSLYQDGDFETEFWGLEDE